MSKKFVIDNKELITQWNYSKNKNYDPSKISYGSTIKVWWICNKKHEWEQSPNGRIKKDKIIGCPYCSNKKFNSGYNDLETMNPDLVKEWNKEKNKIEASKVLYGGDTKYWWKCSKGHEWQASIIERKYGRNCPVCSNSIFKTGYNDLKTMNPDLAKEWNVEKNKIEASEVLYGGDTKYWWKCSKGHEYQMSIYKRKTGGKCVYCNNFSFKTGYNDLETMNPDLAKEWNVEKNKIKASEVLYGGDTKYWWKCSKGHEWQTSIIVRKAGNNCPYCSKYQAKVTKEDSFGSIHSELLKEWNYDKNANIDPYSIRSNTKRKAWWICPKGHEYYSAIQHRSNGVGCPYCYRENQTSFPEQVIYYYMKNIFPDTQNRFQLNSVEIDIYIPSLNLGIEYDGIHFHTGQKNADKEKFKYNFLRSNNIRLFRIKENNSKNLIDKDIIYYQYSNHHTNLPNAINNLVKLINDNYKLNIRVNVDLNKDRTSILESYMETEKENSIKTKYPEIAKEWNYEKNGKLQPEYFKYSSNKKVWWKCSKGHEWQTSPNARVFGNNCPYCSSRRILKGFNDFGSLYPKIAKEWNYKKNGNLTPYDVMPNSNKKVWWFREKCGHEWQTTLRIRTNDKSGCPYCSNSKILIGFNDFKSQNPNIAKEWNYEKNNNLKPEQFTSGSDKVVWWKCSKGHEWKGDIKTRTKNNSQCPYCSGARVVAGNNDFASIYPKLLKEWNWEKNTNITPESIKGHSGKKVWWICPKGHEWQMTINSRTGSKQKCPYCSGKRILKGFNDLETTNPEFISEWDYERNRNILINNISKGSVRKVWWKCSKGHEWEMSPNARTNQKQNCPYCSNKRTLIGYNDLKTTNPLLLLEWDYKKNIDIKPEQFTYGSSRNVWWICSKHNYSYKASISNRTNGTSCPKCASELGHETAKKSMLLKKGSLQENNPILSSEWNYDKNKNILPSNVLGGSGMKVWWKCKECGHEWKAAISNRNTGAGCPICSKDKIKKTFNNTLISTRGSIKQNNPEILKEWNYDKNKNILPSKVLCGSNLKVWWKCSNGHEWQMSPNARIKQGQNCPYCSGRRLLIGYNDFESNCPELLKEWNYEKNRDIKPNSITKSSGKKVWWKCKNCGYEWKVAVCNRYRGTGCIMCYKNKTKKSRA